MNKSKPIPSEIILYQAEEGRFQIALSRDSDTIWLNLNQIADLYQTSVPNISMHVRKILASGELDPVSTVKNYLTVQTEKDRCRDHLSAGRFHPNQYGSHQLEGYYAQERRCDNSPEFPPS